MTSRPLFRCSINKLMTERDLKTLASVTVMMVSYYALAGEMHRIYKIFRIGGGKTDGFKFEKSRINFEEGCIKV